MPAIDYVAEALRRAGKSSESAAEEQMNASDPLPPRRVEIILFTPQT